MRALVRPGRRTGRKGTRTTGREPVRTGCLSLALALLAALAGGCGGHATGVWRPPRECSFAQVANDLALSPGAFRVLFDPKVPAGTGSIHCDAELDGGSARTAVISAYQLHLGGGGLQGEAEVLLPVPEGVSGSRALTCTVSYAAEAGEHTSSHAFAVRVERRLEAPAHEFRAAWTHISKTPDPDDLFLRMAAGGLNAVFLRVRRGETAYYNSSVGPLCLIPYGNPRQLEDCIAAAERHGIDLHVYVNCFNLGQPYSAFAGQLRREGRWQRSARGQDLPWLCPADAANVEIVKQGVLELVRDYPVKGIQYDFIRYPDEDACYCSRCRAAFEEHIGEPVANWPADVRPGGPLEEEYLEVRAGHITRAVRDITAAIRAGSSAGNVSRA